MSNWNYGGGPRSDASAGLLDLKALLNQMTGGTIGPLPPVGTHVNRPPNRPSNYVSQGGAGVIGTGLGSASSTGMSTGLGGGSNMMDGAPANGTFFDPFSSMSTFGFFNPKDPSGTMNKSPTYGHTSPVFGSAGNAHSPINFFSGSGNNANSGYSSTSMSSFAGNGNNSSNKFPISTFSIDDTIQGSERRSENCNSMFGGSSISSDEGNHTFSISHFNAPNNYGSGRERDSFNSTSHHSHSRSNEHGTGDNSFNQGVRETGIIEKLLHSYGFIQCCERQARLFFHFSQFDGTIEHLKLGDPVEFEMTYDRRTGKPIASAVTKIGPEVVLSEERVTGTVTTELHHESNGELQGRISYENRGECFFLPYCQEDIEGNVTLSVGDTVSFQIATNQRSGNLTARYVRLENPARPVRYKGIVSSLKDNFGFIERADVAKEIFFHFSETRITDAITVNDNVEFNIQTRNGKEVACSITKLPYGTVVFEDIGQDVFKGQILKPIDKSQCPSPALGPAPRSELAEGRLRYRGPDRQELEVVYGEKDQQGAFTMRHGDWVQFQLAIDRRNKQQRATNVTLLEESFQVSGERREEGVVSSIKGDTGYITCAERDQKMFFRFSEILEFSRPPRIADDVEFTIVQDVNSPVRQSAIRIKYLKHGSVQFEVPIRKDLCGTVIREPSTPWVSQEALAGILPSLSNLGLPQNVTERLIQSLSSTEVITQVAGTNASEANSGDPGVIQYSVPASEEWQRAANSANTIVFHWKDCKQLRNIRVGTKVIFDIHQVRRNRDLVAANIRADNNASQTSESPTSSILVNPNVSNANGLVQPSSPGQLRDTDMSNFVNGLFNQKPLGSGAEKPDSFSDFTLNGITCSKSELEEKIRQVDLGDPNNRRPSRSPSESSDKVVLNGSSASMFYRSGDDSPSPPQTSTRGPRLLMKGYIAALKDGFGFIETMAQDGEIFFHSSSLVGDFTSLEVGQEVEYVVSNKGSTSGKNAADIVKPLPKGSIGRAAVFPEILQGVVARPLRGANPDQTEYTGLIDGQDGQSYPFGIISMLNKKELLQTGDAVEFQLDAQNKPVNIRAIRKKLKAAVEAVKGQYGFLSYELDDGKKLFFHMSEVKDHQHLNPGDEVEFVILQNPRNGKSSACSVVKVGESQRPERLLNRLSKVSVDESAPRLVVVRQPFGPDGTKGFCQPRTPRRPGTLTVVN